MAVPRLLEGYLFSVLSCNSDCHMQVTVCGSHWKHHGCDLNVRICMKHCVFLSKRRFRCEEKLARVRDGCGRRRFAVEFGSICARNVTEVCSWLFLFFVDAALLCFACVEILCALELVHQSDVFYSSMLQFFCVLQFSLCRSQWNGCAKASRRVLVLKYCLAILIVNCKSLSQIVL